MDERMEKETTAKWEAQQRQQTEPSRSCLARSWSLDSYSTITTADETRDVSVQERSVGSSVVWEGGSPVEINVHSSTTLSNGTNAFDASREMMQRPGSYSYSTPIDLDLMEDYFQYEKSNNKDSMNQNPTTRVLENNEGINGKEVVPSESLRSNTHTRQPSWGLEGLVSVQPPERFSRFEI